MRLRTRIAAMLSSLLVLFGLGVVASAPAQAHTNGHVYLVFQHHTTCPLGGKVVWVGGAVDGMWSGGDGGDNVLYPKVDFHRTNVFNGWAWCDRWWANDYRANIVWKQFNPTGWNQTFWF